MNQPVPAVRSVHHRRLIQIHIHSRQRRQIYNCAVPHRLPDAGKYHDCPEIFRISQEINRFFSEEFQNIRRKSGGRGQKFRHQRYKRDHRDKIRQEADCLDDFFHLCRPHFIQKQCENNWCREAYQQCVKVQQQYISHQSPEIHPCEKLDKVLKSDKFTPYKPEI